MSFKVVAWCRMIDGAYDIATSQKFYSGVRELKKDTRLAAPVVLTTKACVEVTALFFPGLTRKRWTLRAHRRKHQRFHLIDHDTATQRTAMLTSAAHQYIFPQPSPCIASAPDILRKGMRAHSRLSSKQNASLH